MPKRNRHKERIKAERLTQEQIYINGPLTVKAWPELGGDHPGN